MLSAWHRDRQGMKLHGVVCLYSISDTRMGLGCNSMFRLLKEVFGDHGSLRNVVIATTGWDIVNPDRGNKREQELSTDERFLKRALDRGAHLFRHDNTVKSAKDFLRIIFDKQPPPLAIQRDLVDGHSGISTSAGGVPGSQTERSAGWYDEDAQEPWKEQRYISPRNRRASSATRHSRLFSPRRFAREMLRKEVRGLLQAVPMDIKTIGEDLGAIVAGLNRLHDGWGKIYPPAEDNTSVCVISILTFP
jgi:hypothetical protein